MVQVPPVVVQPAAFWSSKSSQSANVPLVQSPGGVDVHAPLRQYGVAPEQTRPHMPQSDVDARLASQPLSGLSSQSS